MRLIELSTIRRPMVKAESRKGALVVSEMECSGWMRELTLRSGGSFLISVELHSGAVT
jgi:hypothetical protein